MRLLFLTAALMLSTPFFAAAQQYQVAWGDAMKMRKGTTDMDVVTADPTGVYFSEGSLRMKSYFVIGASYGTAHKLIKFDRNFNEVYDKEYKRELKGFEFHSFQPLGTELFLFATDYVRKERAFKVYASKVDKNSGDLNGDLQEIGSYLLESKRDDYELKVQPALNGQYFLLVTDISASDRNSLEIVLLDKNLKIKQQTSIDLQYSRNTFNLEDVKYTSNNKIVVLGKAFEEVPFGRRKRTRLVFKDYALSIYDQKGQKVRDVPVQSEDKYTIGGQLMELKGGELVLAGFYSNSPLKTELNGFFLNRLNVETGQLSLISHKPINAGMLETNYTEDDSDEDEETRADRKRSASARDAEEDNEFPNSYLIRSIDYNAADSSYLITAEISRYTYYTYSTSEFNPATRNFRIITYHIHRYENKDILVVNTDARGQIRWINDIPKNQLEEVRTSNAGLGTGLGFYRDYSGFFAKGGGMPYYSGFTQLIHNNRLILIFNDHSKNNTIPGYGDRVKRIYNFRRNSNTWGVSIDIPTGEMTRRTISTNDEETILMPRHAMVVKNEVFLPSWRVRALARTKFKMAKISVK
jgi:hypothetical protein